MPLPRSNLLHYRPPTKGQRLCFHTCLFISHSVHKGVPCDSYLWCIGPHCTGTSHPGPLPLQTSDLRDSPSPGPLSRHQTLRTPQPSIQPLLVASDEHHWRPVQTCLFTSGPPPKTWHLVAVKAGQCKWSVCNILECFFAFMQFSEKNLPNNRLASGLSAPPLREILDPPLKEIRATLTMHLLNILSMRRCILTSSQYQNYCRVIKKASTL